MDLHSNFQSLNTQEQGLVEEETAPFPSCTEIKRMRKKRKIINIRDKEKRDNIMSTY